MEYNGGPAYGPYEVRMLLDDYQQPTQGFTRIIINTPQEASNTYPRGLWRIEYKTGGIFLYDDNDDGIQVVAKDVKKSQLYYLDYALSDYHSWKKISQCSQISSSNSHCRDNPKFNR